MNNTCPYRKMIDCFDSNTKNCGNCGWNPEVSKRRIKRWKAIHKIGNTNKK